MVAIIVWVRVENLTFKGWAFHVIFFYQQHRLETKKMMIVFFNEGGSQWIEIVVWSWLQLSPPSLLHQHTLRWRQGHHTKTNFEGVNHWWMYPWCVWHDHIACLLQITMVQSSCFPWNEAWQCRVPHKKSYILCLCVHMTMWRVYTLPLVCSNFCLWLMYFNFSHSRNKWSCLPWRSSLVFPILFYVVFMSQM